MALRFFATRSQQKMLLISVVTAAKIDSPRDFSRVIPMN
jgi:hypothetical protein